MAWTKTPKMDWDWKCTLFLLMTIFCLCNSQKTTYNMDDRADCSLERNVDVDRDTTMYVNAKQFATSEGLPTCKIDFQAKDSQRVMKVEFREFYFTGNSPCPVKLYIFFADITQPARTYDCTSPRPAEDYTKSRSVSIRLDKVAPDNREFNFQIMLTTYDDIPGGGSNSYGSSPVGAGVIVGIVAGIVVFLIVVLVVMCCCCNRSKRKHRYDEEAKMRLDKDPSSHSVGYINENGRVYSDHDFKPKVTSFDGPGSPKTRNLSEYEDEKPPMLDTFDASPTRNQHFRFDRPVDRANGDRKFRDHHQDEPEEDVPQSPLLAAIRNSARYKSGYNETEAEAEERSRKFSKSSSAPSSPGGGDAPTPPPPLPVLPRENLLRSPQKPPGPKQASIRRAPRPTSSSEEIEQVGKVHDGREGDENIQIIPDSPLEKSQPAGVVAIRTADPHSPLPQRKPQFPVGAVYEGEDEEEEIIPKNNTQHTLRPNRKRSPGAEKRKPPEQGTPKEGKKSLGNQSARQPNQDRPPEKKDIPKKKSQKSPRLGSLRKPRPSRRDDEDAPPSRPDTPTSIVAKGFRTDDLDDFSPLQRTGSRQSLYASRSSLYGRRGKRERSSFTGSVASSYAHDDIDVYRHRRGDEDYDDRPINRGDRNFKSLGDIHYYNGVQKEQATQTLRETASQTGSGMVTHSKARRASQRKSPKTQRAMSSSGTQTKQTDKQSESETKTPRYQKGAPKTKKNTRKVEAGAVPNGSEKKTNKTQKASEEKTESTSESAEEPKPNLPPRARTPDNYLRNQPTLSSSPVPSSAPVSHAPQAPPATAHPQQYPGSVPHERLPFQTYTPPPIHNYGAEPRYAPSPAPYAPSPAPYAPSPAPYAQPPVAHPTKSPWEVLCDLTGGENPSRAHSRSPASHLDSSYSGHHPKQPFYPGFRQPERFDQSQHPDRAGPPSRAHTPSYQQGPVIQHGRPDSAQSEPHAHNNLESVPHTTMYPKKSSWEQLKQLTDTEYKLTYGASTYERSESNV